MHLLLFVKSKWCSFKKLIAKSSTNFQPKHQNTTLLCCWGNLLTACTDPLTYAPPPLSTALRHHTDRQGNVLEDTAWALFSLVTIVSLIRGSHSSHDGKLALWSEYFKYMFGLHVADILNSIINSEQLSQSTSAWPPAAYTAPHAIPIMLQPLEGKIN